MYAYAAVSRLRRWFTSEELIKYYLNFQSPRQLGDICVIIGDDLRSKWFVMRYFYTLVWQVTYAY